MPPKRAAKGKTGAHSLSPEFTPRRSTRATRYQATFAGLAGPEPRASPGRRVRGQTRRRVTPKRATETLLVSNHLDDGDSTGNEEPVPNMMRCAADKKRVETPRRSTPKRKASDDAGVSDDRKSAIKRLKNHDKETNVKLESEPMSDRDEPSDEIRATKAAKKTGGRKLALPKSATTKKNVTIKNLEEQLAPLKGPNKNDEISEGDPDKSEPYKDGNIKQEERDESAAIDDAVSPKTLHTNWATAATASHTNALNQPTGARTVERHVTIDVRDTTVERIFDWNEVDYNAGAPTTPIESCSDFGDVFNPGGEIDMGDSTDDEDHMEEEDGCPE